jgi:hypothetical protein
MIECARVVNEFVMAEHKSFRISDFSLRDAPWGIAAYLIISAFAIGLGLLLESLPRFWSGLLLGAGGAFIVAFILLRPVQKKVDIATLPNPSDHVKAMCDDPACSFIEAVKAYRDETGLGLSEATAVLKHYQNDRKQGEQSE